MWGEAFRNRNTEMGDFSKAVWLGFVLVWIDLGVGDAGILEKSHVW